MHTPFLIRVLFADKNSTECSYFYIPIWAIFAINQIFFTLTALKIHRTKQHHPENSRQIMVLLMASRELDQIEVINEEKYVSLEQSLFGNLFAKILSGPSMVGEMMLAILEWAYFERRSENLLAFWGWFSYILTIQVWSRPLSFTPLKISLKNDHPSFFDFVVSNPKFSPI